jgi:hypothetical protein
LVDSATAPHPVSSPSPTSLPAPISSNTISLEENDGRRSRGSAIPPWLLFRNSPSEKLRQPFSSVEDGTAYWTLPSRQVPRNRDAIGKHQHPGLAIQDLQHLAAPTTAHWEHIHPKATRLFSLSPCFFLWIPCHNHISPIYFHRERQPPSSSPRSLITARHRMARPKSKVIQCRVCQVWPPTHRHNNSLESCKCIRKWRASAADMSSPGRSNKRSRSVAGGRERGGFWAERFEGVHRQLQTRRGAQMDNWRPTMGFGSHLQLLTKG